MENLRRMTALAVTELALLGAFSAAWGQNNPMLPPRVEVDPNALKKSLDGTPAPMNIEVRGISMNHTVWLEVLRDCNGDGEPERGVESCDSPIEAWTSTPANALGVVSEELIFEARNWELPDNVGLWLRASHSQDDRIAGLAPFGLLSNACDLWSTLVDTFFGGDCDPHLTQALSRHKGAGLEDVTFEVRRLPAVSADAATPPGEPIPVPATHGATGVSWVSATTLLVTKAVAVDMSLGSPRFVLDLPEELRTAASSAAPEEPSQNDDALPAGLFRIPLDGGEPELLWNPEEGDDLMPAAPLALPDGRVAFVRQPLIGEPLLNDSVSVFLGLWDDGAVEPAVLSLPYRVHQLVSSASEGREILALTLGVKDNRPLFLHIDLRNPEPSLEVVGYHHGLYHAAMRSPGGGVSAIAVSDIVGRQGWRIALVDSSSRALRYLVARPKAHDLMPAWSRDGKQLAYLAEVSRFEDRWR